MTEKPPDRGWWATPAATFGGALIGAVATIIVALIARQSGAINISLSPTAAPTVTVTAAAPTVTVTAPTGSTATASPSGIADISCPANNNCKAYDLIVGYNVSIVAGIIVMNGTVDLTGSGEDIDYMESSGGLPEIARNYAKAISLSVTAQDASLQQCISATSHAPDAQPITNFYKGMLFCVQLLGDGTPGDGTQGVALMEQTKPLDSSNTLYLHEIYWPNQ